MLSLALFVLYVSSQLGIVTLLPWWLPLALLVTFVVRVAVRSEESISQALKKARERASLADLRRELVRMECERRGGHAIAWPPLPVCSRCPCDCHSRPHRAVAWVLRTLG